MAKRERPTGFDNLINTTTEAFAASAVEKTADLSAGAPKMVNNRQSVYRVPLSMILPDRFQARFTLPHAIRKAFYAGQIKWAEATKRWLKLSKKDRLVRREIEELTFLGESLQDEGQIKPVTGLIHLIFFHSLFLNVFFHMRRKFTPVFNTIIFHTALSFLLPIFLNL